MWAGDAMIITDWDIWMLRYTWSQIAKDTTRFPAIQVTPSQESVQTCQFKGVFVEMQKLLCFLNHYKEQNVE